MFPPWIHFKAHAVKGRIRFVCMALPGWRFRCGKCGRGMIPLLPKPLKRCRVCHSKIEIIEISDPRLKREIEHQAARRDALREFY